MPTLTESNDRSTLHTPVERAVDLLEMSLPFRQAFSGFLARVIHISTGPTYYKSRVYLGTTQVLGYGPDGSNLRSGRVADLNLGVHRDDQNGRPSISFAIRHQVAHWVGPPTGSGVSSRLQVQPGRNPVWSDVDEKRMPGAAADEHTHIAGVATRRPKATWENPGE